MSQVLATFQKSGTSYRYGRGFWYGSWVLWVLILVVALSGLGGVVAPRAAAAVPVTAGDGGIVEQTCGVSPVQIRVDAASASGGKACFGLVADSGWVAVTISGSYGVVNNLGVPVSVAFKLPDGSVYWSASVGAGEVKSVTVGGVGSTVVELHVAPVVSPSGPSTEELVPGVEQAHVISLRSAVGVSPRVLQVSWFGVGGDVLTRNSDFMDRLDGSFVVREGLSDPSCVSLESAAYPGVFLQADPGASLSVGAFVDPDSQAGTWCVSPAGSPATSVRLFSAVDQRYALSVDAAGVVSVTTEHADESAWFVDEALAYPGQVSA